MLVDKLLLGVEAKKNRVGANVIKLRAGGKQIICRGEFVAQ